jgi:hypothetical protein
MELIVFMHGYFFYLNMALIKRASWAGILVTTWAWDSTYWRYISEGLGTMG